MLKKKWKKMFILMVFFSFFIFINYLFVYVKFDGEWFVLIGCIFVFFFFVSFRIC